MYDAGDWIANFGAQRGVILLLSPHCRGGLRREIRLTCRACGGAKAIYFVTPAEVKNKCQANDVQDLTPRRSTVTRLEICR